MFTRVYMCVWDICNMCGFVTHAAVTEVTHNLHTPLICTREEEGMGRRVGKEDKEKQETIFQSDQHEDE